MAQRYEMREEPDDLWSIIDVFTGRPATVDSFLMVGLTVEEANDMLYILNNNDLSDKKAKGIA
jgi:type III secretory pathway lipoprotein EscJ